MDNKEKEIQKEIEKTMQSLDHPPRLKANPWLFTRIEEQLKTTEKSNAGWTFSQSLRSAIVCCLLLINFYTVYIFFSKSATTEGIITNEMESEYAYMVEQSLEYYIPE